MNKVIITLLSASALVLSTAGMAATTTIAPANDSNNGAGFYVSGNLGYGYVDIATPNEASGVKISRDAFAWTTAVGYQFNKYIALEGGYMWLPDVKVSVDGVTAKATTTAIDVAVKGIYPLSNKVDVFAKAGLARLSHSAVVSGDGTSVTIKDTEHDITPLFGLGVDYNLTHNWAVSLQGLTTLEKGDDSPATYTTLVGVTYKFG